MRSSLSGIFSGAIPVSEMKALQRSWSNKRKRSSDAPNPFIFASTVVLAFSFMGLSGHARDDEKSRASRPNSEGEPLRLAFVRATAVRILASLGVVLGVREVI
jgi:hypothetical protein